MYKIVEFSHLLISDYLKKYFDASLTILDATCGNGYDTKFIAENISNKCHIDAYDIQEIAINNTKELLKNFSSLSINYYLDSHENIDPTKYDLAIFNLGYLPNGDKNITTTSSSTIIALTKLINQINNNPRLLIIVVIYPGHKEGLIESNNIDKMVFNLSSSKYLVTKYLNYNRPTSPYIITISKNK